jgi:hypothetical protein
MALVRTMTQLDDVILGQPGGQAQRNVQPGVAGSGDDNSL